MTNLSEITDTVKEKLPEMVKDNKGALVGALVGFFISDNKKAQSVLLSTIAGSLLVDKKKEK